jgi:hypothetical protein
VQNFDALLHFSFKAPACGVRIIMNEVLYISHSSVSSEGYAIMLPRIRALDKRVCPVGE